MIEKDRIPYTITGESVTVIFEGRPHVIQRGAPNYLNIRKSLLNEDWPSVPLHLRADTSLVRWAKDRFTVSGDEISFDGTPLPKDVNARISEMAASGENPEPLFKFWERLQKNPSHRSVQQLYRFLNNIGIPVTEDGSFLAYKSVRRDYRDLHSGKFDNRVGVTNRMPRNQISDDPNHSCHEGLHVGALEYAESFGGERIVICKIDPSNVVCVPFDSNSQKMRVCEYKVVAEHLESHLPSTVISDSEIPKVKKPGGKRSKLFKKLDAFPIEGLMQVKYDDLRKYASKGLGLIGVSKISGGKLSLVTAIVKARG